MNYSSCTFSPNGRQLVLHSKNEGLHVLDAESGTVVCEIPLSSFAHSVALSPDGQQIVSCSDKMISVWNPVSGAKGREWPSKTTSHAAFSPDGMHIISSCRNGIIYLWHAASGHRVSQVSRK